MNLIFKVMAQNTNQQDQLHDENIELKKEIERLKGEMEWISVKDRLPQTIDGEFLCLHIKFDKQETAVVEILDYYHNDWYFTYGAKFSDNPDYRKVTHWMPLPKSPL